MRNFTLYIALFLFSLNSKSQEMVLVSDLYPELRYHSLKGEVFFSDYRQVKGSPYLINEWMLGDISLDNGKELKTVRFKLDVFAHRILLYQDNLKRVVITEKEHITEFTMLEDDVERRYIKIEGVTSKAKVYGGCYFKVLSEGDISLYKLNYKDKMPIKEPIGTYVDEFVDETNYIVALKDEYKQIRLSKAYFIIHFPEYKAEIKKFIRKNKLKVRKEKDFIVAIEYLDDIAQLTEDN